MCPTRHGLTAVNALQKACPASELSYSWVHFSTAGPSELTSVEHSQQRKPFSLSTEIRYPSSPRNPTRVCISTDLRKANSGG